MGVADAQLAPVKKRNRKEYADSVRQRLKNLADSVQEIRAALPDSVKNDLPEPAEVSLGMQAAEKGRNRLVIWAVLVPLAVIILFIFLRRRKHKG